jgi:hypothetical protein
MRSRILKPAFFSNEDLSECTPETRLLFAGLWCLADREGRIEYRPARIRAEVFPYPVADTGDVLTPEDIHVMICNLQRLHFVEAYEVGEKTYLLLPEFLTHQKPHPREAVSKLPGPTKDTPRINLGGTQDTPRRPVSISVSVSDPVPDPVSDLDLPKKEAHVDSVAESDTSCQQVIDNWNEMARTCDLPQPRELPRKGSTRAKALKARATEPAWMADYRAALAKIPASLFLTGKSTSRDNGTWRANLDWFLRPDTVGTILEGKYDGIGASRPDPDEILKALDAEEAAFEKQRQEDVMMPLTPEQQKAFEDAQEAWEQQKRNRAPAAGGEG